MFPLEFRAEVNHEETRVMGMVVAGVVLTQCQRVADEQIYYSLQYSALHSKLC